MALWAALSFLPDADVIGFGLGVRYEDITSTTAEQSATDGSSECQRCRQPVQATGNASDTCRRMRFPSRSRSTMFAKLASGTRAFDGREATRYGGGSRISGQRCFRTIAVFSHALSLRDGWPTRMPNLLRSLRLMYASSICVRTNGNRFQQSNDLRISRFVCRHGETVPIAEPVRLCLGQSRKRRDSSAPAPRHHGHPSFSSRTAQALRARTAGRSAGVGRRRALAGSVTTAIVFPVMSKNSSE
jgi:hypothetical protein